MDRGGAAPSIDAGRVLRRPDGGVQGVKGGQGGVQTSGASRRWSGSTGLARVHGLQDVDHGAGRGTEGKLWRERRLGQVMVGFRGLKGCRGTRFDIVEHCTTCWAKRGGYVQWHCNATAGSGPPFMSSRLV